MMPLVRICVPSHLPVLSVFWVLGSLQVVLFLTTKPHPWTLSVERGVTVFSTECQRYFQKNQSAACRIYSNETRIAQGDGNPGYLGLVSYMLVHFGWVHLLTNVAFQTFLAWLCGYKHDVMAVLGTYVLGVLVGAAAFVSLGESRSLVGCSAGVYALLGLCTVDMVEDTSSCRKPRACATRKKCESLLVGLRLLLVAAVVIGDALGWAGVVAAVKRDSLVVHTAGFLSGLVAGAVSMLLNAAREGLPKNIKHV